MLLEPAPITFIYDRKHAIMQGCVWKIEVDVFNT